MTDDLIFPSSEELEEFMVRGALTIPQKEALIQIYILNEKYPKRWFPACELTRVVFKTLDALVSKGYLITRFSEANPKVRHFQYTGKDAKIIAEWVKNY